MTKIACKLGQTMFMPLKLRAKGVEKSLLRIITKINGLKEKGKNNFTHTLHIILT